MFCQSGGEGFVKLCAGIFGALLVSIVSLNAQPLQQDRITRPINDSDRFTLLGHMQPKALPEDDQGRVAPSKALSYVTLELRKSDSQQAELDRLLAELHDPNSPNYHQWLSPEEFGARFGASGADIAKITEWLKGQGLDIASVARGRNWIAVNGEAANIERAFQTEIHQYLVKGQMHFANAADPSVPAAIASVVTGVRGLNDFRMKPSNLVRRSDLKPRTTAAGGEHFIAPNDFATIYNVTPLYAAGIDGSGQSLVIVGQTQINLSDIQHFRTSYLLPANVPQTLLVPNSQDPGISRDDLDEADLDIEWSGSVARNAKIIFVYSSDVVQSTQYAIDQALAPVISQSYGLCELETPRTDATIFRLWAQQASAEGITWFSASGDTGAADCGDSQHPGLAVDLPGSVPEVTSLGGTEFNEGSGSYWNTANDSNDASAKSYIPEKVWNDSTEDADPASGGGGASVYFTKPSWQTGPGVPGDNARDVPDVSLSASADHDGYFVFTKGRLQIFGGTSVAAPAFAGIATLLNHYLVSSGAQTKPGLGNMNAKLYSLAQTAPSAFHDIVTGDNIVTVPCSSKTTTCTNTAVGFHAGKGFDRATGLGSVDAAKFVKAWHSGSVVGLPTSTSMTLLSNLHTVASNDAAFLIASVIGANGVTPTGSVQFSVGGVSLGLATLIGSGGAATATLSVSGSQLPSGSGTITAVYNQSGSGNVTASVTVSVSTSGTNSGGQPVINAVANGASYLHSYAPGMVLAVFGTDLAPSTATASAVPLPSSAAGVAVTVNGVAAPLYFVSENQLNIQIPYLTAVSTPATLKVNNNGLVGSFSFNVASQSPGIFADANGSVGSAARGGIATVFITGAGAVIPEIATGAAPLTGTLVSELPRPIVNTSVTVGGIAAIVEFSGIPWSLVGVTQVNFKVPEGLAIGSQPVIVTLGGAPSPPASLTITN